jgi:hypothetical protein
MQVPLHMRCRSTWQIKSSWRAPPSFAYFACHHYFDRSGEESGEETPRGGWLTGRRSIDGPHHQALEAAIAAAGIHLRSAIELSQRCYTRRGGFGGGDDDGVFGSNVDVDLVVLMTHIQVVCKHIVRWNSLEVSNSPFVRWSTYGSTWLHHIYVYCAAIR